MLIDLPDESVQVVRDAGYRVTVGSLGRPLRIPHSFTPGDYIPLRPNGSVPGFAEQEVVVVQQRPPEAAELTREDVPKVTSKTRVWAKAEMEVVDSRPWLARSLADDAKRILDHGGIFIMFCEPRWPSELVSQTREGYEHRPLDWSVWDLVSVLDSFTVSSDHGVEVSALELGVAETLRPHLEGARFDCTVSPGWRNERWLPLAASKYGDTVAGLLVNDGPDEPEQNKRGLVFLLPQVEDIGGCVRVLLDEVLPALSPQLFPESERTTWVHDPLYELPGVMELEGDIAAAHAEASRREAELREQIAERRTQDGWMHTLLVADGDELVDAVAKALSELGLKDVRKVDDEEEEQRTGRRREDIQVWGQSPVMLVEVKGGSNLPKEHNALQVAKYLHPRRREWDRLDVRGLSVINQQRGLPPLARENVNTFQDDVLTNATAQEFGLLTTIDLFCLLRNKRRWEWPDAVVAPLLYQDGRIHPIPLHYEKVGVVDGFYEKPGVVTITVTDASFAVGEVLAFVLPIDYEQHVVESVRLDDEPVQAAAAGQRVGLKTTLTKQQARKGLRVYRVKRTEAGRAPSSVDG